MKITIQNIQASIKPIVCLTAYTAPIAQAANAHCDLLLVGDSVAMVLYGEDSTRGADMDMMIRHGRAVVNAAPAPLVIVDMPFGTYEDSPIEALKNSQKIMDETGCDGVKLEGGESQSHTIKYLTDNDIPVMAHIGLLPQSVTAPNGYKVQGREGDAAKQLLNDAQAVQAAGAFSLVIEAVPEPLAVKITNVLDIPTIGIGASAACDGQILVTEDMLGFHDGHIPKFVKQYAHMHETLSDGIECYAKDVKARKFPEEKHTYKDKNQQALKKAS